MGGAAPDQGRVVRGRRTQIPCLCMARGRARGFHGWGTGGRRLATGPAAVTLMLDAAIYGLACNKDADDCIAVEMSWSGH